MESNFKLKTFLGTGWSFPPDFNNTSHQVKMVSEGEDIKQSLMILLSTTPGERIGRPEYGCDLESLFFNPINAEIERLVRDRIDSAVYRFESRIIVNDIRVNTRHQLDGLIQVEMDYTIRSINIRDNIVFPFYKIEGTNVETV